MRRAFAALLLWPALALAGTPDTTNPVPASGSAFISSLQTFLRNEDADRYDELFGSVVVSGCLGATAAGLTHTPTSCTAYPGGYRTTETGSITYADATSFTWVIAHKDTTGDVGTFTRVAGTHYLTDVSATQPTLPADSTWLMKVTTAGGSITAVTDLRSLALGGASTVISGGVLWGPHFGVTCNGSDVTTLLQALIDAACASASSSMILLPIGTCVISDRLLIQGATCDGLAISGLGRDATIVSQTATWDAVGSKPAFLIEDADGVMIQDLRIEHASTPGSSPSTCCTTAVDNEPGNTYVAGIYSRATAGVSMAGPQIRRVRIDGFIVGIRPRGNLDYVTPVDGTYIDDVQVRNVVHGVLAQVQDNLRIHNFDAHLDQHTSSAGPAHPIYLTLGNTQYTQQTPIITNVSCRPYDDDSIDCSTSLRDVDGAQVSGLRVSSPSSALSARAAFHCNKLTNSIVTNVVGVALDPGAGGSAFGVLCGSGIGGGPCTDNLFSNVALELDTDIDRIIMQLEDNGVQANVTRNVFRNFYLRNNKTAVTQPNVVVEGTANQFSGFTVEQQNNASATFLMGGVAGEANRVLDFTCINCTTTGAIFRQGTTQTGLFLDYVDNNGIGAGRLLGAGSGNFGDSGVVADGSRVFCPDCQSGTGGACAASGNGALAVRVNDTWVCSTDHSYFTFDDANSAIRIQHGASAGGGLFLSYDDAVVALALGKLPLAAFVGDDATGDVVDRGPTLGLMKPDIDEADADQSAAEVYLAGTASPISEFGGALDAVATGDVLGRVGFFGSDGTNATMQWRGAAITAVVNTTNEAVSAGPPVQIPTDLRVQVADDASIIFGTDTGELCCNGQPSTGTRMTITNGGVAVSNVTGSGKAVCVKANGNLGVCSDAVGGSGTCTCS